jgi:tetratricopeptide (TPR) repeat protein
MTPNGPPEALLNEARNLHRQNRVAEAIAAYQGIVDRWPASADSWFNLAVLQRQVRNLQAALDSYQKALDAGVSRPEEAHLNRSVIFADFLRDYPAAERELNHALKLNPVFTPAWLNLGNLCEDLGRWEDASAAYGRILGFEPQHPLALARFANLQPRGAADPALIARLRRVLADPRLDAADRAGLGFALGRLLDATGEYSAAFDAYAAANQASRAGAGPGFKPYDAKLQHAFIDDLIAVGAPKVKLPVQAGAKQRPIFICGMFRSGSTLTEQLLSTCEGVAAGGEIDFLPRLARLDLSPFPATLTVLNEEHLQRIRAKYEEELARVSADARFITDKRPDNFLYIGLIKSLYPDARIVHTVRNALDNCLSIYFLHLDAQMSYALDLADIGNYYREYRRLMAHWKSRYGEDIIELDYDELVRDPEPTVQRLCDSLGLTWSGRWPGKDAPAGAVKTASVWQVREPLYKSSSGRAANYARQLESLAADLSEPAQT